jgi:hypothetical protein
MSYLDKVRRIFCYAFLALLAAPMVACASRPLPPAKPPPADSQTRLAPEQASPPPPPRIIAPPPAYGNKVVLAQGDGSGRF